MRPGRKMRVGERIRFAEGLEGEIVARGEFGERTVRFSGADDLYAAFERIGHVPLPPYIKRADEAADRERYQTVFAREKGSVAAPTAGLHFTGEVLDACRARGAEVAYVTLHVGLGTFQPLHDGARRGGAGCTRSGTPSRRRTRRGFARRERVVAVGHDQRAHDRERGAVGRAERAKRNLHLPGLRVPPGRARC